MSSIDDTTARLVVGRVGERSVVKRAFATSPLRLLTPGNRGHAAWVYASSLGGGFVGGDRVALDVEIADDATAVLLSQSSTKIYRSPSLSAQTLTARVARAATLMLLPDPVACFAGSRFRQRQRVALASDASLLLVDTYTCGRASSGERWLFDEYDSRIEITREDRRLVHEAVRLDANAGALAERHGRFDALAFVVLSGPTLAAAARALLADLSTRPLELRADLLVVASALDSDGVVVRVAGTSVEKVTSCARRLLSFVPALLHDDPWERRR